MDMIFLVACAIETLHKCITTQILKQVCRITKSSNINHYNIKRTRVCITSVPDSQRLLSFTLRPTTFELPATLW